MIGDDAAGREALATIRCRTIDRAREGGFIVDSYSESQWWERMAASHRAVLDAADVLTTEMGPAAVAALESEMALTLELQPYRRVVAVAM